MTVSTGPFLLLMWVVGPWGVAHVASLGRDLWEEANHQALVHEPQPQAWIQGGVLVTPRAGFLSSCGHPASGSSETFFV